MTRQGLEPAAVLDQPEGPLELYVAPHGARMAAWEIAGQAPEWHTAYGLPCADDPDAWFQGATVWQSSRRPPAKVVQACRGCPFRRACLSDAIAWGPEFGVWGGYGAAQIRRMRVLAGVDRAPAATDGSCGHAPSDEYTIASGEVRCRACNREGRARPRPPGSRHKDRPTTRAGRAQRAGEAA